MEEESIEEKGSEEEAIPITPPLPKEKTPPPPLLAHCIICAVPDPSMEAMDSEILSFFLKKLLKYQLLSNSQISTLTSEGNNAIHFCTECDNQLTSSFALHLDILDLESKLDELRSTMEDKILATLNSDGFDFWCLQVRKRVREESLTITPDFFVVDETDEQGDENSQKIDDKEKLASDDDSHSLHNDNFDDDGVQEVQNAEDEDEIAIIETLPPAALNNSNRKRKIGQQSPHASRRRNREAAAAAASKIVTAAPCPLCPMKFPTSSALSTHIARSHKQTKFTCLVCSMTFSRKDYFQVHISCHSDYPISSTGGIGDEIDDPVSALANNQDPIDLSSGSASEYEGSSSVDSEDSDFFPQQVQKPRPKKKSTYQRKYPRSRPSKPPRPSAKVPYDCPLCSLTFRNYPVMIRHLNKEHDTKHGFSCEVEGCERKFLRQDFLASHARLEHGDATTAVDRAIDMAQEKLSERTCPKCYKICERPSTMKNHHAAVHTEQEKQFICEICAKQFLRADTLKKHVLYHTALDGGKIFKCDHADCDKSFRRKRDMEVHQRLHTGVKGLLCSECGISFRHEWSFRRHNILLHNLAPNKTYACKACPKVFKIKWHLDQHLMAKSHGGIGLKKRVRRRKDEDATGGGGSPMRKVTRRVNKVQEHPIDLVFEQKNSDDDDESSNNSVPVRPLQQQPPRFIHYEILPPSNQQSQNFPPGVAHSSTSSTSWWPVNQPGFNPTQHNQFY